jgi:hypothetical protein
MSLLFRGIQWTDCRGAVGGSVYEGLWSRERKSCYSSREVLLLLRIMRAEETDVESSFVRLLA